MYIDPSGDFFIVACVALGALIGGLLSYKYASEAGYQGFDLIAFTLLGTVIGAGANYLIGIYLPVFLGTTFSFSLPSIGFSGSALLFTTTAVSVTGVQIATTIGSLIAVDYIYQASKKRGDQAITEDRMSSLRRSWKS